MKNFAGEPGREYRNRGAGIAGFVAKEGWTASLLLFPLSYAEKEAIDEISNGSHIMCFCSSRLFGGWM
ncbi:MAG: hypothetical protein ACLPWS_00840 [Rhodomicrobium sp.]